ncbi:MAG: SDR family NAD(P)-dependent oxidoreductase, partial [Rhodobacterales bacterium]|nr:SDR family NAD(P)-dependent oxidoreductase [Rhodobacterales bacterium]
MTPTLLSFGHGYSARALARLLLPQGWRIIGTTRRAEAMAEICASGVHPVLWPGSDLNPHIAKATHLLISAAPDAEGDPVLRDWQGA